MIKRFEWFILVCLAAGAVFLWGHLALPRYQSIDLSIDQPQAVAIADQYLKLQRGVDTDSYLRAVHFTVDEATDRFLQKTIGVSASQKLVGRLHYDLFCWVVRFYKEKQKEEYKVAVSSADGKVIGFTHSIEDTAFRPDIDKEKARQKAFQFLKETFGFNAPQYIPHNETVNKFDHRCQYAFFWQNKDVVIPWDQSAEKGQSKLLTSVTVSGQEILSFNKYIFVSPDGFNRYVDNLKQIGQNLSLIFRIFYLALLTFSIVVVVNRKHQVVARSVKPFYVRVGLVIFLLMILDILNSYQEILYSYPTTQSLGVYFLNQLIQALIGPFFIALGFVLPALAGESLCFEVSPQHQSGGILSTLLSSFRSLNITRQILVGYLLAAILLGLQSFIFSLGFKYCGVWDELSWLTQASTAVFPAFTALAVGFQASFSEEAMFRLFAINFLRKYGIPTILAVFLSALLWGFGHTGYEIYPMWFRGLEVTCVGIVMGIFYLRYGIVCVIAAHFLIDAFWSGLPYLLNPQGVFNFYSSLSILGLPLVLAAVALAFKSNATRQSLNIRFNPQQQFNYDLLLDLCRSKSPEELIVLKKNLERHGWDMAILRRVFPEYEKD